MNAILTKVPKTLAVSDFRAGLAGYLAKSKKAPIVIADRRGGESYVVLGSEVYNQLLEMWEDQQDARELTRLVKEQKGKKFIPWEKVREM